MCVDCIATLDQLKEVQKKHAPTGGVWIRLDRFCGEALKWVLAHCKQSEDGMKVKV